MDENLAMISVGREKAGTAEATAASRILLISSIIVNIMEQDEMLVLASVLNLAAGFLVVKAAFLEAEEQQIAPGVTTPANRLKILGSIGNIGISVILLIALLIEVSIRQATAIGAAPTIAGATGAVLI